MDKIGFVSLLFVIAGSVSAPRACAKEKSEFPFITAEELIVKCKVPRESWDFVLIDARNRVEFEDAYILGAINIPAEVITIRLPQMVKDKGTMVIFYCNGPQCTKSRKAAISAKSLGYSHISIFNGGMPAWRTFQQPVVSPMPLPKVNVAALKPIEAYKEIATIHRFVLDVRDSDEFPAFHLKDSVNIPLDDIAARIQEVPDRPILLVDHVGRQTLVAGRLLTKLERKDVKRLDMGLQAWKDAGLPLEKKNATPKSN